MNDCAAWLPPSRNERDQALTLRLADMSVALFLIVKQDEAHVGQVAVVKVATGDPRRTLHASAPAPPPLPSVGRCMQSLRSNILWGDNWYNHINRCWIAEMLHSSIPIDLHACPVLPQCIISYFCTSRLLFRGSSDAAFALGSARFWRSLPLPTPLWMSLVPNHCWSSSSLSALQRPDAAA